MGLMNTKKGDAIMDEIIDEVESEASGLLKRTAALWCCYIDDATGEECGEDAEWVIWDGVQPFYDHFTHGCTEHVGALLADSLEVHQVYPVTWDEPVLEVA